MPCFFGPYPLIQTCLLFLIPLEFHHLLKYSSLGGVSQVYFILFFKLMASIDVMVISNLIWPSLRYEKSLNI